jgi:hypothetical protein
MEFDLKEKERGWGGGVAEGIRLASVKTSGGLL